jgi:peptidoglycan/LPS O-acetylase OafA/YrhL
MNNFKVKQEGHGPSLTPKRTAAFLAWNISTKGLVAYPKNFRNSLKIGTFLAQKTLHESCGCSDFLGEAKGTGILLTKEPSRHIEYLDYARGIAILVVFVFHCFGAVFNYFEPPWNGWFLDMSVSKTYLALFPLSLGRYGVAVFFVVSGFCIHLSFYQQGKNWRDFFTRRFFRIYPPYFSPLVFFSLLILTKSLIYRGGWHQFWTHLLLFHNFDKLTFYGVNPSFWSIAVEVQLYLLYPLLLAAVGKFGWRRSLIALAILELSIRSWGCLVTTMLCAETSFGFRFPAFVFEVNPFFDWLMGSPFAYWFSWSIGAAIADAFLNKRQLPLVKSSPLVWLTLAIDSCLVKPLEAFSFPLFAIFTAVVVSKLLNEIKPKTMIPGFCLEHLRMTGIWSYSIYLLHQPLIMIFQTSLVTTSPEMMNYPLVRLLFCVALWFLIMPLGGFWYRICEMPSVALGKKFIQKKHQQDILLSFFSRIFRYRLRNNCH